MTDVVMPQMGESIVEGTLTKWLKKVGDKVERDEPLFEISTDKVDSEIPSPAAGTLAEVLVQEGATVSINTVVARIGEAGGTAAPAPAQQAAPPPPPPPPAATPAPVVAESPEPDAVESSPQPIVPPSTENVVGVRIPQIGEGLQEARLVATLKNSINIETGDKGNRLVWR